MIRLYFRAGLAWLKALLTPIDLVERWCPQGHSILLNWEYCPDCRWMERAHQHQERMRASPPKFLFYCFHGHHQNELFVLRGQEETLGASALHSIVLTCDLHRTQERYRALLGQNNLLISDTTQPFQMNGNESWKEHLFDYDEVELVGNRFLVFDLKSFAETSGLKEMRA